MPEFDIFILPLICLVSQLLFLSGKIRKDKISVLWNMLMYLCCGIKTNDFFKFGGKSIGLSVLFSAHKTVHCRKAVNIF